jgi:hypothetical protein
MTQKLNYTIFNDYLSLRVMRRFFFYAIIKLDHGTRELYVNRVCFKLAEIKKADV